MGAQNQVVYHELTGTTVSQYGHIQSICKSRWEPVHFVVCFDGYRTCCMALAIDRVASNGPGVGHSRSSGKNH